MIKNMNSIKTFREFSNNNDAELIKKFYDAIDWCLYKNYADFDLGDDGPETTVDVEDDELYCVVKGHDDGYLIKEILVMFHSYSAANVFFVTDYGNILAEKILNLQELTEKMLELYKD